MKKLILSFLSPCGRIGIRAFWWRQLALGPLFLVGAYFLQICHTIANKLCDTYALDGKLRLMNELADILFLHLGSCLPAFGGWMAGAMLGDEKAYHLRASLPLDYFLQQNTLLVMAAALGLLLLASWCSFALILRRLRDTRFGLRVLPPCLTILWAGALSAIGAPHGAVWLSIALSGTASLVFTCWPARQSPGVELL